jgi:hypothetical protein
VVAGCVGVEFFVLNARPWLAYKVVDTPSLALPARGGNRKHGGTASFGNEFQNDYSTSEVGQEVGQIGIHLRIIRICFRLACGKAGQEFIEIVDRAGSRWSRFVAHFGRRGLLI